LEDIDSKKQYETTCENPLEAPVIEGMWWRL